jgi:archaellum component FlaC
VGVAYRIARTYLLMKTRTTPEKTVDIPRICKIIGKITNDLNAIIGIKAKLKNIGTTAETVTADVSCLERNIRISLDELQETIRADASKN